MKVIARTSHFVTGLCALMFSPIIARPIVNPTIQGLVWALLAVAVVVRVSQIRLSVGRDFVRVQNFFRTTDVPIWDCLLYTSPSPRDGLLSRMPSSA